MFLVKIYYNLRFETYHFGIKCYIPSLSKNYITVIDSWSRLDECLRFLTVKEMDDKKKIIEQQINVMSPSTVGIKLYGPDIIVRAFEYFSMSRT